MATKAYSRGPYEVSAFECFNQLVDIMKNQPLKGMSISRTEYVSRLNTSIEVYAQHKGINPNWSSIDKEHAFLVKQSEPAFDWWFSIYLSLVEPHEIPLILDAHNKTWNNSDLPFVNLLEYFVLRIQKLNLFHDFTENKKEIITWIREHKNQQSNSGQTNTTVYNIQINQYNEYYYGHSEETKAGQNSAEAEASIGESKLFNSPFQDRIYTELLPFAENASHDSLKEVLLGNKINNKVILKSNFKKVSLRNALKVLIGKGDFHMNQEECAKWLYDNFAVRKKDELDIFSIDGTKDAFRKRPEQKVNSQLKFDDWYK